MATADNKRVYVSLRSPKPTSWALHTRSALYEIIDEKDKWALGINLRKKDKKELEIWKRD